MLTGYDYRGPNSMTGVLVSRGEIWRHILGRRPGDEGRNWSDATIDQWVLRMGATNNCWHPPEARKRQGTILAYSHQREHGPADNLIADSQLPEL